MEEAILFLLSLPDSQAEELLEQFAQQWEEAQVLANESLLGVSSLTGGGGGMAPTAILPPSRCNGR